jgi:DNA mismatch repair protein MutS
MRGQYLSLKKQYPDVILLFRLGDFYESFDDDARTVAAVCDVVLTSRPVGNDQRVPLAGVPYHAVDGYIAKLINAGYKVAIAEQIGNEPPKGEKLVPRVVSRVVTPGTLIEPGLLIDKRNNYLATLVIDGDRAGLAYADITTGEFATTQVGDGRDIVQQVTAELGRLGPAELLIPSQDPRWTRASKTGSDRGPGEGDQVWGPVGDYHVTPYAQWHFEYETARQALLEQFDVASLDAFGCEGKPLAVRAAGGIVQYLRETQKESVSQLAGLRTYSTSEYMTLDEATRRNLELTETIRSGSVQGSLLGVLDGTLTPMGGRALRRYLSQPLLEVEALNRRLDLLQGWYENAPLRAELRQALRGFGDLERWTNRAVQGAALPRELIGLRDALGRIGTIRSLVAALAFDRVTFDSESLDLFPDLIDLLRRALADDPPEQVDQVGKEVQRL